MQKNQRIRRSPEAARAQIIEATESALEASDSGGLTVEAITQRAGMTRSAFYHYFSGLDELVLALLESFEAEIRDSVDPWLEHNESFGDYRAATVHYLSDMYVVFQNHRDSVRAVMHAAGNSRLVYEHWQSRTVDYFIDRTADFIRQQIKLGRSKVDDPERIARALILMNNAMGIDNMQRKNPDEPGAIGTVVGEVWNAVIYGA